MLYCIFMITYFSNSVIFEWGSNCQKMNKNKIITVLCFLLLSQVAIAQTAHNLKPNSICRYVKGKKNHEGMVACNACFEQMKKNEAALAIELKKRIAEDKKQEAENLKKIQEDYVKRSAELKQKIEAQSKNVVSFALPKTEIVTKPNNPVVKIEENKNGSKNDNVLYNFYADYSDLNFYRSNNKLLKNNGEVVFESGKFYKEVRGASLKDTFLNFPPNCAIVSFIEANKFVYDIVNVNGVRTLNDNTIDNIYHFFGPYFLVGFNQYAKNQFIRVGLYNIETKKYQWLADNRADLDGRIAVADIQYINSSNPGGYLGYKQFAKSRQIDKFILVSVNGNRKAMYYLDNRNILQKIYTNYKNNIVVEE